MFQLILIALVTSVFATEKGSIGTEAISRFTANKTNRELFDRALDHTSAKEKASAESFLIDRKLKFEDKIVRPQTKGEELRIVTADGQIFSSRVIDPLKGHFSISGLQLDLDRRTSPLERLKQIENALLRRDFNAARLVIPHANAYIVGTLGSVILGAFALFQFYQETAELRALVRANYELLQAKKDCQSDLKNNESGEGKKLIVDRSKARVSEIRSARHYLNQISTSYICRDISTKPNTSENQTLGEGCQLIQEIDSCIHELTHRSDAAVAKSGSIVRHTGRALKALSWRADIGEVLKTPAANERSAR